jgi:hypothetical protein
MKIETISKHLDANIPMEMQTGDLNSTLGKMINHAIEGIT